MTTFSDKGSVLQNMIIDPKNYVWVNILYTKKIQRYSSPFLSINFVYYRESKRRNTKCFISKSLRKKHTYMCISNRLSQTSKLMPHPITHNFVLINKWKLEILPVLSRVCKITICYENIHFLLATNAYILFDNTIVLCRVVHNATTSMSIVIFWTRFNSRFCIKFSSCSSCPSFLII